jgi:hypothetical protein
MPSAITCSARGTILHQHFDGQEQSYTLYRERYWTTGRSTGTGKPATLMSYAPLAALLVSLAVTARVSLLTTSTIVVVVVAVEGAAGSGIKLGCFISR